MENNIIDTFARTDSISFISNKEIPSINPIPTPKEEPELIPVGQLPSLGSGNVGAIGDEDIEQPVDSPETPKDDIKPGRGQQEIDIDTTTPFPPGAGGEVGGKLDKTSKEVKE